MKKISKWLTEWDYKENIVNNLDNDYIVLSFSCDNNYFVPFLLSLEQLKLKNEKYFVILLISQDFKINIEILNEYASKNLIINLVVLHNDFYVNFFIPNEKHVSKETYSRYYLFSEWFYQFDKILYLDVDLLIISNLKKLWNIELQDNNIGMCLDVGMYSAFTSSQKLPSKYIPVQYKSIYKFFNSTEICRYMYTTKYLNLPRGRYFNNGVVLINVKKCIQNNLFDKYKKAIISNNFFFPGQDPQNFIENNKILSLSIDYNIIPYFSNSSKLEADINLFNIEYQIQKEYEDIYHNDKANIIHFTGPDKPWLKYSKEFYNNKYYSFLKKTNFKENIKTYKKSKRKYKFKKLNLLFSLIGKFLNA